MRVRTMMLLCAAGVGYVLGARAGRERYEQIRRTARRVADHPLVRTAASRTGETVVEHGSEVKDHLVGAADRIWHRHNGDRTESGGPEDDAWQRDVPPTYPRMRG